MEALYGPYPPDLQAEATKTVLEQAEALCAEWAAWMPAVRDDLKISEFDSAIRSRTSSMATLTHMKPQNRTG